MEDVYVRHDVATLEPDAGGSPWDDRMLAYARAVAVMKARAPEDPTGWIAQARLHAVRPRGTWFLLPWLRMQGWYFERIVRAIVVDQGGPADWALPFWGYADGAPAGAALPPAFAAPALPDGTPNPLHRADGERAPYLNAGMRLPAAVTTAARALAARTFSPGFGGPAGGPGLGADPPIPGLLEVQPHDSVAAVLGSEPALDPVFPLHLATVDRLWEMWLALGDGRANPAQFDWADEWYSFHDADGRVRNLTCGQVGDLANLDYAYAGVPARASAERVLMSGADAAPVAGPGLEQEIASSAPAGVVLGAESRRVPLRPAANEPGDARFITERGVRPRERRLYLHLEGAEAQSVAPGNVWEVRVEGGAPVAGAGAAAAVGTIALGGRGADAQRFVFDVTDAVDALATTWDEASIAVTFQPLLPAGSVAQPPAARVGRVFLTRG